jgi:hypothetical protein
MTRRRDFIKRSAVTVMAASPFAQFLTSCNILSTDEETAAALKSEFHFFEGNLANLHFYFINADYRRETLYTHHENESYLVVRIPPQHVAEELIREAQLDDYIQNKKVTSSQLSGFTFLAFRLKPTHGNAIPFELSSWLNWDRPEFQLVSPTLKDGSVTPEPTAIDRSLTNFISSSHLGISPTKEKTPLDYYKSVCTKLFKGSFPVTILEIPAGLFVSPFQSAKSKARFEAPRIKKEEYVFTTDTGEITRSVQEVWNTRMWFDTIDSTKKLDPVLRGVGYTITNDQQTKNVVRDCDAADDDKDRSYLPTLLDKEEIVYLTSLGSKKFDVGGTPYVIDPTSEVYDIKTDGLIFSGLGAIARFHYRNYNPPNECDLVEYEHHISLGRDEYIKVARLGAISVTGQRAVHIKIGQRKIRVGVSYMEFKEFVEIIQQSILYDDKKLYSDETDKEPANYIQARRPDPLSPDAYTKTGSFHDDLLVSYGLGSSANAVETHFRRIPFKGVKAITTKSPPIYTTNNAYFWIQHEKEESPDIRKDVFFEFQATDWNNKTSTFRATFLFVRKKLIDCQRRDSFTALYQEFFSDPTRRIIAFNQQPVSFTPDYLPDEAGLPNKSNVAPTESIEYYFGIAKEASNVPDIFLTRVFPLFPQVWRANVSIENLEAMTAEPSGTVVQYHQDYIDHAFRRKVGDEVKNKAKLIFNLEKPLNGVFDSIGNKLGGIINPDIAVEAVGLLNQGITLPGKINDNVKGKIDEIGNFDPSDLMRGISPEIFGGIKLLDILAGQLSKAETPKFNISNLGNQIDDLSDDPLFNEINSEVQQVRKKLDDLKKKISDGQDALTLAERKLIAKKEEVANSIAVTLESTLDQLSPVVEFGILADVDAMIADSAKAVNSISGHVSTRMIVGISVASKRLQELAALKQKIKDTLKNSAEVAQLKTIIEDLEKPLKTNWVDYIEKTFTADCYDEVEKAVKANLEPRFNAYVEQLKLLKAGATAKAQLLLTELKDATDPSKPNPEYTRLTGLYKKAVLDADTKYKEFTSLYQLYSDKADQISKLLSGELSSESIDLIRENIPEAEVLMVSTFDMLKSTEAAQIVNTYRDAARNFDVLMKKYDQNAYNDFKGVESAIRTAIQTQVDKRLKGIKDEFRASVDAQGRLLREQLNNRLATVMNTYRADYENVRGQVYSAVTTFQATYTELKRLEADFVQKKAAFEKLLKEYEAQARSEISADGKSIEKMISDKINEWKKLPVSQEISAKIEQAKRLLQLLTALKRKEFEYKWETTSLRDKEFGIIVFKRLSNPDTKILVSVKTTVHFSPQKFPAVVDRVETVTYNAVTNFGIGFMKAIMINFNEVSFSGGTGQPSRFDVKIRDVQFEGAFSFVQKLQSLLSSLMGDAFKILIQPQHVSLSYVLPIPGIRTPAFSFFNLTLRYLFRLHFMRRPMQFGFGLASRDEKFTISVGIFAGFGYFEILAEPGKGVTELAIGMEFGGYFGISIGPLSGHIKLAVGMAYIKNPVDGIIIEGYFVCEGGAKLWFIMVSVRFYMGVRSQNNVMEGRCSVSFSLRLGPFFELSFSSTYHKRISGASPANTSSSGSPAGGQPGRQWPRAELLSYEEWVVLLESYKD